MSKSKSPKRMAYVDNGSLGQPGDSYSKQIAIVTAISTTRFQLEVRSVWGSNQGYLEEHDRIERSYRASSLDELLRVGLSEVKSEEDLNSPQLLQAIREAIFEAEDYGLEGVAKAMYEQTSSVIEVAALLKCSRDKAELLLGGGATND